MDRQYQKWVSLSYFALAALTAYVVFSLLSKVAGAYDLEARFRDVDLAIRGVALLLGGLLFFLLYRNDQANQFMNEVVAELTKVTWPTQKETASATLVVIVMVVVSGVILGMLDYFWVSVLKWFL